MWIIYFIYAFLTFKNRANLEDELIQKQIGLFYEDLNT